MLRNLAALLLVGLSASHAAIAQSAGHQRKDSLARVGLEDRINGRALIRVRGDWGTAELYQPRLAADALTYTAASAPRPASAAVPRPLPLHAVDRVQVRGNAAETGALVGAGIGLVAGIAAGIAIANDCRQIFCFGDCRCTPAYGQIVPIVATVSTAGGALLGAAIGSQVRKWKTVYRALR